MGKVSQLFRYPVKSMLGEKVTQSWVGARGLTGDRAFALVHTGTGRIVSAKNPRLWRDMLKMSAVLHDGEAVITLADGRLLRSGAKEAGEVLSEVLGQPVQLTSTPPAGGRFDRARPEEVLREGIEAVVGVDVGQVHEGTFFDFAPLHLITTATLRQMNQDVRRFRPNLVLDVPGEGFVENGWAASDWRIGEELVVRVMVPTPRCAVPTLAHGELPRDPRVLRFLYDHNRVVPHESLGPQPCAGVYAHVVRPGLVREGDAVTPV